MVTEIDKDCEAVAWWHVSLDVDCPKCQQYIDILQTDEYLCGDGFNIESANDIDFEAKCPECGHEFLIKEMIL